MSRSKPSSPPLRHGLLAIAALFGATVLWLAAAAPALAHAALVRSVPADGAVLSAPPGEIALTFSEPVAPLVLRLVAPDGTATVLDRHRLEGNTLTLPLPAVAARGTSVVSWRVVSEDGHPIGGAVVFSVGAPGAVPVATEAGDRWLAAAIWATRLALAIGIFLGVGGVVFLSWTVPPAPPPATAARRGPAGASIAGLAAAPLLVGLHGLDALGLPFASLGAAAVWIAGAESPYGTTAGLAAAALALALVALGRRSPGDAVGRGLAAVALVLACAAVAASGHAASAAPEWLTKPSVALHVAAVALWIGALAPLGLMLHRGGDAAALRRFSAAIPLAVAALLATGVVLACVQLGTPEMLWTTAYGCVLLLKLGLVGALLALGAYNRARLTAPVLAGDGAARSRLVRSIAAECGLAIAILAVVGLWRFTPPPRSLALAAAAPAEIHLHTEKAMADIAVTPGRAGPVTVAIVVMTGEFGPLDPKEITLVLSNPAGGIEAIRRPATRPGTAGAPADGVWRVDGLVIPVPGRWDVRLDILISDFEKARLDGTIDIAP